MPNGDIVSGCSDGVVRIFSASEDRWASSAELQEYEKSVSSHALPSQVVGDVKKSDLPGRDGLMAPGILGVLLYVWYGRKLIWFHRNKGRRSQDGHKQ
jgi:hypothetical protein